jgi:hypothetical protein
VALHEIPGDDLFVERESPGCAWYGAHTDQSPDPDAVVRAAECGHAIADVDGEQQHHAIPDDGAPHSATSECGCGPQREMRDGHVVYVHDDQGHDEQSEQLYREVFGA